MGNQFLTSTAHHLLSTIMMMLVLRLLFLAYLGMGQEDSKWSYIVDRFHGLYLSAKVRGTQVRGLETQYGDGSDNQLWAFDSAGRIHNRGTRMVIDGSGPTALLVPSSPGQRSQQWMLRLDIQSKQEPKSRFLVPKLKVNSRNFCLNIDNRNLPHGSKVGMDVCTGVNPDNAGWNIISAGLVNG